MDENNIVIIETMLVSNFSDAIIKSDIEGLKLIAIEPT